MKYKFKMVLRNNLEQDKFLIKLKNNNGMENQEKSLVRRKLIMKLNIELKLITLMFQNIKQ